MHTFPYSYQNGNVFVTIDAQGTKTREWVGDARVAMPENMDVKVTNYCNLGDVYDRDTGELKRRSKTCAFCHEASNNLGQTADLDWTFELVKAIGAGRELALGGGDTLSHPNLIGFLERLKAVGIIANVTENILHLKKYQDFIEWLQKEELIHGMGISYRGVNSLRLLPKSINYDKVVFHCILGIESPEDIAAISNWATLRGITPRVLLLGYKTFRNGELFYSSNIRRSLQNWREAGITAVLSNFKGILSFDNLAIKQLDMRSKVSDREWSRFWQGDEGSHNMYIDAVSQRFAVSSTDPHPQPIGNKTLQQLFTEIKPPEHRS